jgi:hypothetical protein
MKYLQKLVILTAILFPCVLTGFTFQNVWVVNQGVKDENKGTADLVIDFEGPCIAQYGSIEIDAYRVEISTIYRDSIRISFEEFKGQKINSFEYTFSIGDDEEKIEELKNLFSEQWVLDPRLKNALGAFRGFPDKDRAGHEGEVRWDYKTSRLNFIDNSRSSEEINVCEKSKLWTGISLFPMNKYVKDYNDRLELLCKHAGVIVDDENVFGFDKGQVLTIRWDSLRSKFWFFYYEVVNGGKGKAIPLEAYEVLISTPPHSFEVTLSYLSEELNAVKKFQTENKPTIEKLQQLLEKYWVHTVQPWTAFNGVRVNNQQEASGASQKQQTIIGTQGQFEYVIGKDDRSALTDVKLNVNFITGTISGDEKKFFFTEQDAKGFHKFSVLRTGRKLKAAKRRLYSRRK